MAVHEVTIRFYAELLDFFLSGGQGQRGSDLGREVRDVPFRFQVPPTVKDAIESLGVPHVEVDLILVNGVSVDFAHRLADGDRISVYPVFESLDIGPVIRLRPAPLRRTAFVADVHLRRLARYLRLLGFDTLHSNAYADSELVEISVEQGRTLLTRDRQLLKHGRITRGLWIRSTDPIEQARELIRRFDLAGSVRAFTRCPACNGLLQEVDKDDVADEIPPKTARWLDAYTRCTECGKLYWRGTHVKRLEDIVERILADPT